MKYTFLERDLKTQLVHTDLKKWTLNHDSSCELSLSEKSSDDEENQGNYELFRPTIKKYKSPLANVNEHIKEF